MFIHTFFLKQSELRTFFFEVENSYVLLKCIVVMQLVGIGISLCYLTMAKGGLSLAVYVCIKYETL